MSDKLNAKYKAIFTDVDGTLITNEYGGKLTKRVKKIIINSKKNIFFGIASGRPLDRVTFIFEELGLKKPCIINGGSQIVDPVSRKVLWQQPILPKDLNTVRKQLNKLHEKVWVVDGVKEYRYEKTMKLNSPLHFFISKIEETKADKLIGRLSHIPTLAMTKVVAYHKGYISLQITHAEATKHQAIMKAAQLMDINNEEIIGVGDGYNDYPMFKACGFKVAVGNAVEGLKEKADYIAPPVEDDGVADVLEKFVIN